MDETITTLRAVESKLQDLVGKPVTIRTSNYDDLPVKGFQFRGEGKLEYVTDSPENSYYYVRITEQFSGPCGLSFTPSNVQLMDKLTHFWEIVLK